MRDQAFLDDDGQPFKPEPACPLTGSQNLHLLEEFPTSLLVTCYQRDLGINVAPAFQGIQRIQLFRCLDSNLIFFYPAVTGSSKFCKQLQTFDWYSPMGKFEHERAATWITPGERVLDIGCGAGQFATNIPEAAYTGLDPHLGLKDRSPNDHLLIIRETVTSHLLRNTQAYDVVCAFQVLEHLADPRTFLTAALACLQPDGLLILGVPSAESYVTRISNFVLNAPPHHVTWWTDAALYSLADQFNLSVRELSHAPVEAWESRLYWMHRITRGVFPQTSRYFTESTSRRLLNLAAYVLAGYIHTSAKPPVGAQGASVVMVAKKVHH